MPLKLARVTMFMRDREKQVVFYRDVLGLPVKGDDSDPNVIEFDAGAGSIILVKGGKVGDLEYGPRVVFYAEDVAGLREELELLGVKVGKLKEFGDNYRAFDGVDPEGNPFQVSSRP
jgi:catechol 2,3-dioxygenase-like lactoylglutathione lyase family enzyme